MQNIYDSVPQTNHLHLYNKNGELDYKAVTQEYLAFNNQQVAQASKIGKQRVRYDQKIPKELKQRLREWASALEKVADFFRGDVNKTIQWFQLPNPMLGNISPRDMIRYGRFNRLYSFILSSIDQNR